MKWASAISEQSSLEDAIGECSAIVRRQLEDDAAHLAVVFVSSHQDGYDRVVELVQGELPAVPVFGCSGGGIIGGGQEVEQRPAVSITAASLPGVEIVQCYLENDGLPDLDAGPGSWEALVNVTPADAPQFVMLADPFSFPVQNLILGLDFAFGGSSKIGGLASGDSRAAATPCSWGTRPTVPAPCAWPCTATSPWIPWSPRAAAPSARPCASPRAAATC